MEESKKKKQKEIKKPTARNEHLLPDDICLEKLKRYWELATTAYQPIYAKMRILDACDRGKFWEVLGKDIPSYQLLPDTNYMRRIKDALVSTIYSTGAEASVTARSEDDLELATNINLALHAIWEENDLGMIEMQAGERAALLNVGITQVGWDKDIICGTANRRFKGNITAKNIDPMNFMRDPAADSLDTAAYCIYHNAYHKIWFEANEQYKKEFKNYLDLCEAEAILSRDLPESVVTKNDATRQTRSDYYKLVVFYIKTADKLWEVHTIDTDFVLAVKEVKPAIYPFAELFCELPVKDPVGAGPCAIAFPNYVIYNTMNSMVATQAYKAMRPPRFINGQSGLNVYAFSKHGNDPDKTFVVNGEANRAVHYQEFPALPVQADAMLNTLPMDIDKISGIDGQYTGRDTGSVITTGGMEELMSRVTMLDAPRLELYNNYAKRLTHLILQNLIEYGDKRSYITKDPMTGQLLKTELEFDKILKDTVFNYDINISEILPRNKARLAQVANMLMEKQMQYNMDPAIITPEEWLSMQDLPNMEYIARRMKWARTTDETTKFIGQLGTFNDALAGGIDPGNALDMAVNTAVEQENPMLSRVPNQENVGNINPTQTKEDFINSMLQQNPAEGLTPPPEGAIM